MYPVIHDSNGPPDHWLNIALGIAAMVTAAGVVVGAVFTARYGRRASVSLSASVEETTQGYLIIARPSIKAVGVFRVRFVKGRDGSSVGATELYLASNGDPTPAKEYSRHNILGDAFVDGGEELITTSLVPVPNPPDSVIGWAVWVVVYAPNRFVRLRWTAWIARHPPLSWAVRTRPAQWVRRRVPASVRKYVRWIVFESGWTWTDQVFIPRPGARGQGYAQTEGGP